MAHWDMENQSLTRQKKLPEPRKKKLSSRSQLETVKFPSIEELQIYEFHAMFQLHHFHIIEHHAWPAHLHSSFRQVVAFGTFPFGSERVAASQLHPRSMGAKQRPPSSNTPFLFGFEPWTFCSEGASLCMVCLDGTPCTSCAHHQLFMTLKRHSLMVR